jgi:uncharacterized membrane protein YdjX (TVP38/TMEM64 family)
MTEEKKKEESHRGLALRWAGIALVGALLVAGLAQLPVRPWIESLQHSLGALGSRGMALFSAIYVAAALLLFPGSILTVMAGLTFGLWRGLAVIVIASSITVVVAFLIARYAARDHVARLLRRHPRFKAVDGAIEKHGWKIVALMRFSPVMPFGLQNYAYGLTAIGFWPCILTSWVAMLPGTFLRVYIGHLTRIGMAQGALTRHTAWLWGARLIGLLAAVSIVVYLAIVARKAIRTERA